MTGPVQNTVPESIRDKLFVGQINGVYGLRGWVKVFSYTEQRESILSYSPWTLCRQGQVIAEVSVIDGRRQGKSVLARLPGYDDCDRARLLIGSEIYVSREQLPDAGESEYYWHQLIGLEVVNEAGERLGQVASMIATGANDVLVVNGDRQRLIPFVRDQVVIAVDLPAGCLRVDWRADY